MEGGGWCTIESDPGVFTEMFTSLGVRGAEVVEIVTLQDEVTLMELQPIRGFVFLFKWTGKSAGPKPAYEDPANSGVFFAKQTVQNACATQAILNIVMNFPGEIALGDTLTEFLSFSEQLDPTLRGDLIGEHDLLRTVHNGFARSQAFSFEETNTKKKEKEDVYHFVAYIYKHGAVWELDGLQPGPIKHATCAPEAWVPTASEVIQKRMEAIAQLDTSGTGQGISFNLMAVVEDRTLKLQKLITSGAATQEDRDKLADLLAERDRQKLENIRRRHNYIPTIVALLRGLAKKGKLGAITEVYKEKAKAKTH
eukprot:PhF_6_TR13231/c2_g1_i1/m.20936/K05610/UCHL5, UCH37; ubiquitin carboxyl-terminal hydrolase L5